MVDCLGLPYRWVLCKQYIALSFLRSACLTVCSWLQFDRERIPERVVHARGASAKGFFEVSFRPHSANFPCPLLCTPFPQ